MALTFPEATTGCALSPAEASWMDRPLSADERAYASPLRDESVAIEYKGLAMTVFGDYLPGIQCTPSFRIRSLYIGECPDDLKDLLAEIHLRGIECACIHAIEHAAYLASGVTREEDDEAEQLRREERRAQHEFLRELAEITRPL